MDANNPAIHDNLQQQQQQQHKQQGFDVAFHHRMGLQTQGKQKHNMMFE